MRTPLVWLTAAIAAADIGCSTLISADAGYAHAFAQAPERSAFTTNAYAGAGYGGEDDNVLFGGLAGIRTKWSDSVQQGSLALGAYFALLPAYSYRHPSVHDLYRLFLIGGASVITYEAVAGRTSASAGSPWVELAGYVRLSEGFGLTAGVSLEDDIRFDDLPSTGYLGFVLGIATLSGHGRVSGLY